MFRCHMFRIFDNQSWRDISIFDFWWIFRFQVCKLLKIIFRKKISVWSEYVHPFDESASVQAYHGCPDVSYHGCADLGHPGIVRDRPVSCPISGHQHWNSKGKTWHWIGSLGTLYTWAFYFLTLYDLFISACQPNAFVKNSPFQKPESNQKR